MSDEQSTDGQRVDVRTARALLRLASYGDRALERAAADTYAEFVSVLYDDLDEIFGRIEDNKSHYSEASEDAITIAIVGQLKTVGYIANHDPDNGGHCDVVVESRWKPNFKWLGEAKIDNGPAYLWGGWLQLTERYSNARPENNKGGMLVYVQSRNAVDRMNSWSEHLHQNGISAAFEWSGMRQRLAFATDIRHTSGQNYGVRHMALNVHHNPVK